MMYATFEDVALFVAFVASAAFAMRTLAPATWRAWKQRALISALQPGRPAIVRRAARRFVPPPAIRIPAAACKACNGCEKAAG